MVNRSEQEAPRQPVDWYAVLGIAPDADEDTARTAWRGLARAWHPDRAGDGREARDRFEAIQEAFQVIGDPERRRVHDHERRIYADAIAPLPASFVERLVGVRRSEVDAGRNRLIRLSVSSADVVTGASFAIELPDDVDCAPCGGTGVGPFGRPRLCDRCGGRCFTVVRPVLRAVGEACARCNASGWLPDKPCAGCGGRGIAAGVRTVTVAVPAGVANGQQIRLAGLGERAVGVDDRGDLVVAVDVTPGRYSCVGDDWEAAQAIPFWRALAGGPCAVATPWGEKTVRVPAGTREGELLKLDGLGVGRRGDGYLKVVLTWPERLSSTEAAALVAWGEGLGGGDRARSEEERP